MTAMEILKTMSALSGIGLILFFSGWLKVYLKAYYLS